MAQSLATDTSILARASQQDSAVMRAIAVDTKKDSSSMKTIAVLGMLFLPSTLIAVCYSFSARHADNHIDVVPTVPPCSANLSLE